MTNENNRRPCIARIGRAALAAAMIGGANAAERSIPAANPPPEQHAWHTHNKVGLVEGAFLGVTNDNRALIREADGTVLEVPLFHLTVRDLSYILNQLAKFPDRVAVPDRTPDANPVVDLRTADLPTGPLTAWQNRGALGGAFRSMNRPPTVEEIHGRKGVRFDYSQWYIDPKYNALVADVLAPKSLAEGKPFTLSAWILHPEEPDVDDPEVLMSWHGREGNRGTAIDWKLQGGWGSLYVAGLGGDLHIPGAKPDRMPAWTHMTYVYTGGGLAGEFRVYENGTLKHTVRGDRLPSLKPATEITADSVVLNGRLDAVSNAPAHVVAYLGTYDAHYWMQMRHIGQWDMNKELGRTYPGDFSVKFDKLKPGTRYYYRMLSSEIADYANYVNPTRRWANGVGSFITATRDGQPGQALPVDGDQFMFIGVNWGSRWYASYPGPSGWFRGYLGDVRLFDRALDDLEVRREAGMTQPFGEQPPDGSAVGDARANLRWCGGVKDTANFRVYLSPAVTNVTDGTAMLRETAEPGVPGVDLLPGRTYYWRVDQLAADGAVMTTGKVWSFRVTKGEPSHPFPEDGSTVNLLGDFRWQPDGSEIREQRLYLGQSAGDAGTTNALLAKLDGRAREFYKPEALRFGKTYYWRIDTTQADGTGTPGPVWSFTVRREFEPEFDGPSSEPFFDELRPGRQGARVMEGMGNPTITTPGADEATLRDIAHATKRYLLKSKALRQQLAATPCATTMDSPEGSARVAGFACGSYGGMPNWWMTMHEMGHQTHGALIALSPDFLKRQNEVFAAHADNNAWLGDYASVNIYENMAVSGHQFISGLGRERLLRADAPMYHLLADYLPGDLCVELHPAWGLSVDGTDRIVRWGNRGGVEDFTGRRMTRLPESTGSFAAIGSPELQTQQGVTAVRFGGTDALAWDLRTQYGFEGNRAWSVEFWARRDQAGTGDETLLAWGSDAGGARFLWGGTPAAYRLGGGQTADWPAAPATGCWNHLVYVFEGGGLADGAGPLRVYVNGGNVLERRHKLTLEARAALSVGGIVAGDTVTGGFRGALAHLRAYNYALSRDQVLEHFEQEGPGYRRQNLPAVGGKLYVDLDADLLQETGTEDHRPLYSPRMHKPWVRSWANRGTLGGRVFNDISEFWHYSGSTPLYRDTAGVRSLRFLGKDRMVADIAVSGTLAGEAPGTIEAWVYADATSAAETVLEWGDFSLDGRFLKPGWQHVGVISCEGARSEVYVDGRKVGEIPGVLRPKPDERLHLGAHFDAVRWQWSRFFNGALAAVRIHQKALSPEELAGNARTGTVALPHAPAPAQEELVVAERNPALSWTPGLAAGPREEVSFGESPGPLAAVGVCAPGEYRPALTPGKTYAWRVGRGPVWTFTTRGGALVDLAAEGLADGRLPAWTNAGRASGRFVAADRGDMLGPVVKEFKGTKGLQLSAGKVMLSSFEAPACLGSGAFTLVYRVAAPAPSEAVPFLSWGAAGSSVAAAVWFGTWNEGRKCLTWGALQPAANQKPADGTPYLAYPGGNATMAYFWRTVAIVGENGAATLYLDGKPAGRQPLPPGVSAASPLTLGFAAGPGQVLLNTLRIYDTALSPREIERAGDTRTTRREHLVVDISADGLQAGERVVKLNNGGTLSGVLAVEAEPDRAPVVRTLGGRKAVVFDGTAMLTSDILLPEALTDCRPFTVEMWAWSDADRDARLFAFTPEITSRHTSFAFGGPQHRRGLAREFGAVDWDLKGDPSGHWTHLAWVYDGGEYSGVRLYRDGQLNAERAIVSINTIGGYPMSVGGLMHAESGEKALFKGGIAGLKVYDYARTADEIAAATRLPGAAP